MIKIHKLQYEASLFFPPSAPVACFHCSEKRPLMKSTDNKKPFFRWEINNQINSSISQSPLFNVYNIHPLLKLGEGAEFSFLSCQLIKPTVLFCVRVDGSVWTHDTHRHVSLNCINWSTVAFYTKCEETFLKEIFCSHLHVLLPHFLNENSYNSPGFMISIWLLHES